MVLLGTAGKAGEGGWARSTGTVKFEGAVSTTSLVRAEDLASATSALSDRIDSHVSESREPGTCSAAGYSLVAGRNSTANGQQALAAGYDASATGGRSVALGLHVTASGNQGIALGAEAGVNSANAFVWNGYETGSLMPSYYDHGAGTINVNPKDGFSGFNVGDTNLADYVAAHSQGGGDYVPLIADSTGAKTAAALGARASGPVGANSLTVGPNAQAGGGSSLAIGAWSRALGNYSFAQGNTSAAHALGSMADGFYSFAQGNYSHASGTYANALHARAMVWQGVNTTPYYPSHGAETFNLNPEGGIDGIYIGEKTLRQIIAEEVARLQGGSN